MSPNTDSRASEYKPLLFTTTVRNPERVKGLLAILSLYNNQILTNELATHIMGNLIKFGLYRPTKIPANIKEKWNGSKKGHFSLHILTDEDVKHVIRDNPQQHKEAGFDRGWPSRFATEFDFAKELGFVYFSPGERIDFSEIGLKYAHSIDLKIENGLILVEESHPELEQQAFLHSMAKYQRNNPFKRVLNDNVPLVLLLQVISLLNSDKDLKPVGISKLELPILLFWKNNDAEALCERIKQIRKLYGLSPSWEIIIGVCVDEIMEGNLKKYDANSIMVDYPDEFIRKMRITGLISLRGGGRFVDINTNEQKKVNYVLAKYSKYEKYQTKKEYYDYMAEPDEQLFAQASLRLNKDKKEELLSRWVAVYSWEIIKKEMLNLSREVLTKDMILKYLSSPVRLEFLTALAVKSRFPSVSVVPNYPVDDEGLPTSTAGGIGDKGDIECYENTKGILLEVTMSKGRVQTIMEVWPISRHLDNFRKLLPDSICYFIAPSIFADTVKQIAYVKQTESLDIYPITIDEFIHTLENSPLLYRSAIN